MDSLLHATMRRTTSLAAASAMLTMYGPDDKKPDDDTKAIVDAARPTRLAASAKVKRKSCHWLRRSSYFWLSSRY